MANKFDFTHVANDGRVLHVEAVVEGPDYDVGIVGPQIHELWIVDDETGEEVELPDEELKEVEEAAAQHYWDLTEDPT